MRTSNFRKLLVRTTFQLGKISSFRNRSWTLSGISDSRIRHRSRGKRCQRPSRAGETLSAPLKPDQVTNKVLRHGTFLNYVFVFIFVIFQQKALREQPWQCFNKNYAKKKLENATLNTTLPIFQLQQSFILFYSLLV